jgi:c-di-GMP phosphodiesterase
VPATQLNCFRLLAELEKLDLDFKRLETFIRGDVALTYKLLRYVNSALFGRRGEIQSVERALTPGEVATLSIVRARFCERLIQLAGIAQPNEAF